MRTGVFGQKGHVHFTLGRPLNSLINAVDWAQVEESKRIEQLCHLIDHEIHRNYQLYPINYIAWDKLEGTTAHSKYYTADDWQRTEAYIQEQISRIEMPNGVAIDSAYIEYCLLEMYANPARNFAMAHQS